MPYTIYDTEALVVGRRDYKDANTRLMLYTEDLGRLSASAQSIRKVDAKLSSGLQVYSQANTSLVYGKSGWRIVGVIPGTNFFLKYPKKRGVTVRTTRLLRKLVPDQQPDQQLYATVANGLEALTEDSRELNSVVEQLMVFRMLAQLGYAPDPQATELESFTASARYDEGVLKEFTTVSDVALSQINRSLKNIQF